jgi:hypothetical protein
MATDWEAARELGRSLSEEDADALEAAVRARPDEPGIRVVLVGYYFEHASGLTERAFEHVSWLARNHADLDHLSELPPWAFDSESRSGMTRQWLLAIDQHPDDAALLVRAHRNGMFEPDDATSLIERGLRLAPNNAYWQVALAQRHRTAAREASSDALRAELAREAAAAYARAAELESIPANRVYWMNNAAKLAFEGGDVELARTSAMSALAEVRDDMGRDFVIHDANIVLGNLALAANDVATACLHLVAAPCRIPEPDEPLALALLARGERDAVVAYMAALRTHRDHGFPRLEAALRGRANSR